jgi:hypothetical protein
MLGSNAGFQCVQSHIVSPELRARLSLFNLQQVHGRIDHPAVLRGVGNRHRVTDPPQAEATGRCRNVGQLAMKALDQRDFDFLGHDG